MQASRFMVPQFEGQESTNIAKVEQILRDSSIVFTLRSNKKRGCFTFSAHDWEHDDAIDLDELGRKLREVHPNIRIVPFK